MQRYNLSFEMADDIRNPKKHTREVSHKRGVSTREVSGIQYSIKKIIVI